jgi:hypothetical protein
MMGVPDPGTVLEAYTRELIGLVEEIVAGGVPAVVLDQATAERWLIRLVGMLVWALERHRVDRRGRCSICRIVPRWWWPWPRWSTCTLFTALSLYLHQSAQSVLAALADRGTVRRAS